MREFVNGPWLIKKVSEIIWLFRLLACLHNAYIPKSKFNVSKLIRFFKASKSFSLLRKNGAGEEIRTLDFNLGKVALYP